MGVAVLVLCVLWTLGKAFRGSPAQPLSVMQSIRNRDEPSSKEPGEVRGPRLIRRVPRGVLACGAGTFCGVLGFQTAGPVAGGVAAAAGVALPFVLERRRERRRKERLEGQFAEYVEAMAMAARGGLSIPQAAEFAAGDVEDPLAEVLRPVLIHHRYGTSFDRVLDELASALATNETRMLTLVLRLHSRTGGNLAPALDEVGSAIRDRITARRELHALSAQGRMSGLILASLPVAFFFVLAASSRTDMLPVLRSPAGIALVCSGLCLQGLGYAWIRRLLRVRL